MAEALQYTIKLTLVRIDPDEPEQPAEEVAKSLKEDILEGVEFWAGGDNGLDSLTGYRIEEATVTPVEVPDGEPATS